MDPSAPPSGKRWTECNHCGHWFDRALPTCDACGKPNDGSHPAPADDTPMTLGMVIKVSAAISLTLFCVGLIAFRRNRMISNPVLFVLIVAFGILFGLIKFKKKAD